MRPLVILCLALLPWTANAQITEVPTHEKLRTATIEEFKPPYKILRLYMEDESQQRHSLVEIVDTTLYVKASAMNKRKRATIKPAELMQATDFKAGMKVSLMINYLQVSNRTVAERICLDGDYYGTTSIKGLYEYIDGDQAIVDGQVVKLNLEKDKAIMGRAGWAGKRFTSFAEMQLGAELDLYGERRTDGIIYVSRGTMTPSELGKDDYLLRKATDKQLRVTRDELNIANTWKFRFIANNRVEDYVSSVGRKLIPAYLRDLPPSHPDHVAFKFYLVNDGSFNASSFPNGAIIVHSGLFQKLTNEAQLAAILGHEIAHITQRHHTQQYRRNRNWQAAMTFGAIIVATGGTNGDPTPLAVIELASEMSVSTFSQLHETQADRVGMHYMVMAGYDPREAANIWKRMAEEERDERQQQQQQLALNWINKSLIRPSGPGAATPGKAVHTTGTNVPTEQPLFPAHPAPRQRFTHVNFLVSTTYGNLDLTKVERGEAPFREVQRLLGIKSVRSNSPKSPGTSGGGKPPRKSKA